MSVENGERRRLTAIAAEGTSTGEFPGDFIPAVAPDGRFLAFRRAVTRNSFNLFLLPLARGMRPAGDPRRLTRDSQVISGLAWTADGKDLVFSSGTPGNVTLFRIGASGEGPRPLTQEGEILNLTVTPRSNRLVFARSRREMDIYRAEMFGAGSEVHKSIPLIASSRLERYPSYSPDGKKIAFVSLRSGNWQLWVSGSDGENALQMTSFGRGEVALPAWSPDGTQIGFTSNAEGAQQAYTVDAAGGRPRKLEALGKSVFNFRWSRDGRWIFVLAAGNGNLQLFKVPAAGGAPTQMTREGAGAIAESFDDKLVYYIRPGGVRCVPVEGGPEQVVFKSDINPGVLEANRRGVYFTAKSTPTKNGDLMFYPFPKGPVTRIAGVETGYGFSLSPDGRYLVYTKMTATGSDLMLVENFR
jgi:Tol biopolymer transport system component